LVEVDFTFKETADGFSINATDEDGNVAESKYCFEKKLAQKPEMVEESWKKQFSKLGGTIFEARNFSFDFSKPYFVPLSSLNDWRREVIANLYKIRIENYPRIVSEHKKTDHHFWAKELDYSFNVANRLARAFYERHGAKVVELAFEQQKNIRGKKLMTTKYCIKYFLGVCPKNLTSNKLLFKEPLFLIYNGRKFRLSFNCENCEMEVWNG